MGTSSEEREVHEMRFSPDEADFGDWWIAEAMRALVDTGNVSERSERYARRRETRRGRLTTQRRRQRDWRRR